MKEGLWSLYWPDFLHKLARKSALALTSSGANVFLKKCNRLFRLTRGPWNSSKFGRMLQDARQALCEAVERGEIPELVEGWLPGCAKDARQLDGSFKISDLLAMLRHKKGRGTTPTRSKQ